MPGVHGDVFFKEFVVIDALEKELHRVQAGVLDDRVDFATVDAGDPVLEVGAHLPVAVLGRAALNPDARPDAPPEGVEVFGDHLFRAEYLELVLPADGNDPRRIFAAHGDLPAPPECEKTDRQQQ